MDDFYVYIHCRKDDGSIFYVGKGRGNRAYQSRSRNRYWHNIVNKHGYYVDIIAKDMSEQGALDLEVDVIHALRSSGDNLANITSGGDGVRSDGYPDELRSKLSEVTSARRPDVRAKISRSKMGIKPSNETLKKLSEAQSLVWKNNPEKRIAAARRRMTSDVKSKISESCKAYWTEDKRKEASERRTGNSMPDHVKAKIASVAKDRWANPEFKSSMIGKMGEKRVRCSNGMVFNSINSAVRWLRENGRETARQSNICSCCSGILKTAYGYAWEKPD